MVQILIGSQNLELTFETHLFT